MQPRRTAARTGTRRPAPLQVTLGITVIALAALLAACSSPGASANGVVTLETSTPGGDAAPSASAMTPEEAALAFAQCMRDHGVDMPDPVFSGTAGGGGGTVTQEGPDINPQTEPAFNAAIEACKHFQDDIKRGGSGQPMGAAEQKAFLDYAACMRDHGVDMADPIFEDGGVSIQIGGDAGPKDPGGVDPQSAAFQAAQTACNHFLREAGLDKFADPDANGPATPASAEPSHLTN